MKKKEKQRNAMPEIDVIREVDLDHLAKQVIEQDKKT